MIMYFSGSCGATHGRKFTGEPENVLGDRATIMLSFGLITNKKQDQHLRVPLLHQARLKKNDHPQS